YPKLIRHLLYFFKVIKVGRDCDLVFTQDPISTGLPALLAAKIMRKPLVMRVAGDYAWEQSVQRYGVVDSIDLFQSRRYGWRVELLRKLQSYSVKHSTLVITPSEYFKNLVDKWTE